MKNKIALIIIVVLIVLGFSIGVGYKLSNKNNTFNDKPVKEEKIEDLKEFENDKVINDKEENTKEEALEEKQEDNKKDALIEDKPVEKVNEKNKEKTEKKQEVKKETTTKTNDGKNTSKQNAKVSQDTSQKTTQETTQVEVKKEEKKVETKQEELVKKSTPTKTVVSTENVKEESSEQYKYGVVLKEVKTYTITTYSDGTTDKKLVNSKKSYDKSGYNGTTETLKSEAQSVVSSNKAIYQRVLENVNTYRNEVGAANISLDDKLTLAATIRAMEMAYSGDFNPYHNRPNGSSCFTVLKETGISFLAAGENIAEGYANADKVSAGWKDSEGHYKNMISKSFSKMGVGMCSFDGTKYWVQIFTN